VSDFFSVHHVGGRVQMGAGTYPWVPEPFLSDEILTLYDADEDALRTMAPAQGVAATNVFPYCLGERDSDGMLHLNFDPFASSLLPAAAIDPELHQFSEGTDYVMRDAFRTLERRPVRIRALDELDEIRSGKVPAPDFLVLDTQGTELDILRGARKSLAETTVALQVEVEFVELYKGQALFGDIASFLRELDFDFVQFVGLVPKFPYRLPLGQRAGGYLVSVDGIWLKRITSISHDPVRLSKLAFAATFLGQAVITIAAIQQVRKLGATLPRDRAYGTFLCRVLEALDKMPQLYPSRFDEIFTARGSAARFSEHTREILQAEFEAISIPIRDRLMERQDELRVLLDEADSPLEKIMREYGFGAIADDLKTRRLQQVAIYLKRLGVVFERTS
jgi:FkbM family methyltransferase